jgi:uncharacterized protein YjbI with pentapeptide repeats
MPISVIQTSKVPIYAGLISPQPILRHANLKGANLCGANLCDAQVTQEQIALAKTNWLTVMPSGKRLVPGKGLAL